MTTFNPDADWTDDRTWLRNGQATDQALRVITGMITSGETPPGARLPTERELATATGLSRNTIREAVRALELMGVLDVRQGAGTYVSSLEPRLLLQTTELATRLLREDSVSEIFGVRRILEAAASADAAARITEIQLTELQRLLDTLCTATEPVSLLEADMAFHNFIADCSGNELLASLVRAFGARTLRARLWQSLTLDEALMEGMRSAHWRIFEAIRTHDPGAAASASTMHILEVVVTLAHMKTRDPAGHWPDQHAS